LLRDDEARFVADAGDWDGDGQRDLVLAEVSAPGVGGAEKEGRITVYDPRTRKDLYVGSAASQPLRLDHLRILPRAAGPAWWGLTLADFVGSTDQLGRVRIVVRQNGDALRDSAALVLPAGSAECFLVDPEDDEVRLLTLVFDTSPAVQQHLALYVLESGAWRMLAKQELSASLVLDQIRPVYRNIATRVADLDGDGERDVVFTVAASSGLKLLWVASRSAALLGITVVPRASFDGPSFSWVDAQGGAPGQLLLPVRTDAGGGLVGVSFR
jgi:hypothetical protein